MTDGSALRRAAAARGVQLSYVGHDGRRVRASTDTLRAVLAALDGSVGGRDASEPSTGDRRRGLEPVVVVSARAGQTTDLRTDRGYDPVGHQLHIAYENGGFARARVDASIRHHRPADPAWPGDEWSLDLSVLRLPVGYHRLTVEGLPGRSSTMLVVPPDPAMLRRTAGFGLFAPLYALRGREDWGVGSFTELARLTDLVGSAGGELAATLPLYATFSKPPIDPSPYLPVSRLFWNDLYLDATALPELARSSAAREVAGSQELAGDLARLRELDRVDYATAFAVKRRVVELCAEELFGSGGPRREQFEQYAADRPALDPYAQFRAAAEQSSQPWWEWGSGPWSLPGGLDADAIRYHQYAQFAADEQLGAAAGAGDRGGAGLYLDLPVGVHPHGFDTWWEPSSFAAATVGAPPDGFFAGGQSWGFPALHPERIRETGYRYLIDTFRTIFRYARAIRVDHVLGLQRLYWIPQGSDARDGAYVHYRTEEIRAILAVEAHRAGALVVGEDLGTVSPRIRQAMDTDGILHSFVYQFSASAKEPFPQPTSRSLATLGSHDLPKFAAFWKGTDISDRHAAGDIDDAREKSDSDARRSLRAAVLEGTAAPDAASSTRTALRRCLLALAGGSADQLVIDLADLELDDVQDNRPGTGPEAGNWMHRHRRPLEDIAGDGEHRSLLAEIAEQRLLAGAASA